MIKHFAHILLIYLLLTQSMPLWGASYSTRWPVPSKKYQTTLVVADSSTDVLTTNAQIFQISVANTTASACTFLVQDRASSAKTIIPTVSIGANTAYVIAWPEGFYAPSGVKWTAGTASCLHAQVKALYE